MARRRTDEDFAREIEAHVALEIDRLVADGMSPGDARHAAARRFGNVTATKERFYRSRRILWLEELRHDVRYAWRMYAKAPGFAAAVVVTLALGIGALGAVFTLADHMLFRPLPYPDADRLVRVSARGFLNAADVLRARERGTSFDAIAEAELVSGVQLPGMERGVLAYSVDRGFLEILGTRPQIGRAFAETDYEDPTVALITWSAYQRGFGGRRDILEQAVTVDGPAARLFRIVGVLPRTFVFPDHTNEAPGILVPRRADPAKAGAPNSVSLPLARLRRGVSTVAATTEMTSVARSVERDYPRLRRGRQVVITPLREALFGPVRMPLVLLLVSTAAMLLLACANLAHLFMARLHARRQELAIRLAIGAGRWRVARQLAVESALLALGGGVAALAVARVTIDGILARAPRSAHVYRLLSLDLDGRVVAFVAMLAAAAAVLASLLIARRHVVGDIRPVLAEGGSTTSARTRRHRLLIGVQAAVTVSLMIASALMVHSFVRLLTTPTGFNPQGLRAIDAQAPPGTDASSTFALHRSLYEHVRARSQSGVAMTDGIPALTIAGVIGDAVPDSALAAYRTSGTFAGVVGLEIVRGRYFDDREAFSNAPVVVLDEAAARRLWPDEEPLGRSLAAADGIARVVIGVVRPVRMQLTGTSDFAGTVFLPMDPAVTRASLVVGADVAPDALSGVNRAAGAFMPGASVGSGVPLAPFEREIAQPRFLATLLGALAVVTVLLAAVGIYGVVSDLAATRRREVAIRLAVGADPRRIQRRIVRDAFVPAAAGVAAGVVPTVWWAQTLRGVLHDVRPGDPATVVAASLVVLTLVIVASVIPAARASKINPLTALRSQ